MSKGDVPADVMVEFFQQRATSAERLRDERLPPSVRQNVKSQECCGSFVRQLASAALGGMNAQQQVVKRKRAIANNDDLAIEHKLLRRELRECLHQLGKIPAQRLAGF